MSKSINKDVKKSARVHGNSGSKMKANNAIGTISTGGGFIGTATLLKPPTTSDISQGITINDLQNMDAQIEQARRDKYDFLMNTDNSTLKEQGYYVTTDNGSIFKGDYTYSVAYLPIQDIQFVENERGTAGALLMKMNQPALAKDTAGYAGGSSGTFSGQPPAESTPIPEVQVLPPVVANPTDGTVTFDPGVAPSTPDQSTYPQVTPTATTGTTSGTTSNPVQSSMLGGGKYWWLWYLLAAIIVILYLKYGRK